MVMWELDEGMLRQICFETPTRYWSYSGSNSLCRFLTWDQAQFERFSYILSNGYRHARRNVIYQAKRK